MHEHPINSHVTDIPFTISLDVGSEPECRHGDDADQHRDLQHGLRHGPSSSWIAVWTLNTVRLLSAHADGEEIHSEKALGIVGVLGNRKCKCPSLPGGGRCASEVAA